MSIGKRIKSLREKQHMTIKQVAESLGVSASTYRDWELGTKISGEPYVKMAGVLKTSLSYLMTGEEPSREDLLEDLQQMKSIIEKMERDLYMLR